MVRSLTKWTKTNQRYNGSRLHWDRVLLRRPIRARHVVSKRPVSLCIQSCVEACANGIVQETFGLFVSISGSPHLNFKGSWPTLQNSNSAKFAGAAFFKRSFFCCHLLCSLLVVGANAHSSGCLCLCPQITPIGAQSHRKYTIAQYCR